MMPPTSLLRLLTDPPSDRRVYDIPPVIVRWSRRERIRRFLSRSAGTRR
jgi:hypothetical protein